MLVLYIYTINNFMLERLIWSEKQINFLWELNFGKLTQVSRD